MYCTVTSLVCVHYCNQIGLLSKYYVNNTCRKCPIKTVSTEIASQLDFASSFVVLCLDSKTQGISCPLGRSPEYQHPPVTVRIITPPRLKTSKHSRDSFCG